MKKIIRSSLWRYPSICANILLHPTVQAADPILFNEDVYLLEIYGSTVAYCTLRKQEGYLQLMDVFTFKRFRKRGYGKLLLNSVLDKEKVPAYLMCREAVAGFYAKLGFVPTKKAPEAVMKRVRILNYLHWFLLRRKHIAMVRNPSPRS